MMKLKETHPTFQKFEKVCDLMDSLGVSFLTDRMGRLIMKDNDVPGDVTFYIQDVEALDGESYRSPTSLPPGSEVKIVFEQKG